WVADPTGVVRIDPASDQIREVSGLRGTCAGGGGGCVLAGRDVGWVSRALAGVAYRLNPDGDVVRRIRADAGAGFLAYASGSLWDGNHDAGRVSRYDASTGQHLADLTSSHPIDTISAGGHYLLVDTGPGRALGGIISGLGPNTAVFAAHPGELFG